MYTVYRRDSSGSAVVEAVLGLIGEPYKGETMIRGPDGRFQDSLYRINPLGNVPVLVLPDGTVMTESAAMVLYLADTHRAANLAPPIDSPLRPLYLRWMLFLAVNVYMSILRIVYSDRYTSDPASAAAVRSAAQSRVAAEWDIYAAALGKGPFILGEDMSAADIYAAMLVAWNDDVPTFFQRHPQMRAMYERVTRVPAVAKVWTDSKMEQWI
ncbi:glutathione S-transferase family protein [soil metagenome]